MKVIFPFVGDTVGGSHHSSQLLMSELQQNGIEVLVFVHKSGPLKLFFEKNGTKIASNVGRLPYLDNNGTIFSRFFRFVYVSLRLWAVLIRSRANIVHVNDARMMISWALASRLARVRLVVHQRTVFAPSRIAEFSIKMAKNVISISNFVQKTLPQKVISKSTIVANPFKTNTHPLSSVNIRTQLNIDDNAKILLFVGTLQNQKQPMVALAILNELLKAGTNVVLVMAGRYSSAAYDEIMQFAAERHISQMVKLLGYRTDITCLYEVSDVLLAPAIQEGFGRAVIESMINKVPVVAANSGGHREIIEDNVNGFLCPPGSVLSFVDVIKNIFGDPGRRNKIVEAASVCVSKEFQPRYHAKQVLKVYKFPDPKIAFVIESMGGGGTQQVLKSISTHFLERGVQQTLITFKDPSHDIVRLDPEVQRITIKMSRFASTIVAPIINNIGRIYSLRRAISKSEATIIISFLSTTNILVLIATLGMRKRIVVSERNDPYRQKLKNVWNWLRRIFYPLADSVVCNSQTAVNFFSKWKGTNNVILIENAVRQLEVREEVFLPKKYFLFVGRLHEQKRADILIKAFSQSNLKEYELLILGDGPLKDELKSLADSLSVKKNIKFLGHLTELSAYYSKAHAFVMCSDYEGSPNALWEALSLGAPCIVTDSIEEAVCHLIDGESGLIVKSQNICSLANALTYVAKNKEVRDRLKKNGPRVIEKFSHDNVNKKWDRLIFGDVTK